MAGQYFVEGRLNVGDLDLEGTEFHHMVRVGRAGPGDEVRLFDAFNQRASATIQSVSRSKARLRISAVEVLPDDPAPRLVLATVIPRSGRSTWLIEKATELGVAQLIPLVTSRTVVDPGESKLGKLRQTMVEACKQSGRTRLMGIGESRTWKQFLSGTASNHTSMLAHPGGTPLTSRLLRAALDESHLRHSQNGQWVSGSVVIAIGPEGGFTEDEVAQAGAAGLQPTGLGTELLRIETAGVFAASVFRAAFMER